MDRTIREMKVVRIKVEFDRMLLYPSDTRNNASYHVIADLDCGVSVGDVIQYEPFGINFGWFVSRETQLGGEG